MSVRKPNPIRETAARRLMSAREREPRDFDWGETREA